MHSICAAVAFMVTLVLIDIPLKVVSLIFFLVLGFLMCLIYPIAKNISWPNWFLNWYDYAKSVNTSLAVKVWNAWQP